MNSAEWLGTALLVIGAVAIVSEMHTLTIYLLAVTVGCFVGAVAAFSGAGLSTTLAIVGAVVLLCLPAAHWLRRRLKNRESDDITHDDVGHRVEVIAVGPDNLRVSYRGTAWQARMRSGGGAAPLPGQVLRIARRDGNVLVLEP